MRMPFIIKGNNGYTFWRPDTARVFGIMRWLLFADCRGATQNTDQRVAGADGPASAFKASADVFLSLAHERGAETARRPWLCFAPVGPCLSKIFLIASAKIRDCEGCSASEVRRIHRVYVGFGDGAHAVLYGTRRPERNGFARGLFNK